MHPKLNDKVFGMPERQKATSRIINMFQMKFENQDAQQMAMGEFGSFLRDYALTADEVLEAYRLVAKVELVDFEGEPIIFYPNLSIGQAGKILKAYENYKIGNSQHTQGIAKIKTFLNPPAPELTPEEKKELRLSWLKVEYSRLQKEGKVLGTTKFYEEIKARGIESVKLSFLENVLDAINFKKDKVQLPGSSGQYAKLFFIENFVRVYFDYYKLKDMEESDFVEYWQSIYDKSN